MLMSEPDADLLRRVLVQIRNQRKHLQPGYSTQDHADRFHEQLDRLEQAGYDCEEFRLDPERDMYRFLLSSNSRTGEKRYADKKSVQPGILEAKMDMVLD